MKRLLLLFTLFLIAPALAAAQEDTGWPVIERCVGEPTVPPDNWTFEGTILLRGYAGIHGVNAAWETPRVLVFLNNKYLIDERADLPGGALSPDGKWYASPFGKQVQEYTTYNIFITLSEVRVYSTETDEVLTVPIYVTQFFQGDYGQVFWIDNETFFYRSWGEEVVFNPFDGTARSWEFVQSLTDFYFASEHSYFSPDWTRYLRQPGYLYDLENSTTIKRPSLSGDSPIAWSSDSQYFVGLQRRTDLTLFDRNGKVIEKIYIATPDETLSFATREWSPDNRYLPVFIHKTSPPYEQNLYLLDLVEHQIVDLCAAGSSRAWAADSTKMFFQDDGRIQALDMNDWQLYTVAYHDGQVIGWRAD